MMPPPAIPGSQLIYVLICHIHVPFIPSRADRSASQVAAVRLDVQGWMFKKGAGAGKRARRLSFAGSGEKKRFFVLDGPDEAHLALTYYATDKRQKSLGSISMAEVIAVVTDQCDEAADNKALEEGMFLVRTEGRDYYFRPADPNTYTRWPVDR